MLFSSSLRYLKSIVLWVGCSHHQACGPLNSAAFCAGQQKRLEALGFCVEVDFCLSRIAAGCVCVEEPHNLLSLLSAHTVTNVPTDMQ